MSDPFPREEQPPEQRIVPGGAIAKETPPAPPESRITQFIRGEPPKESEVDVYRRVLENIWWESVADAAIPPHDGEHELFMDAMTDIVPDHFVVRPTPRPYTIAEARQGTPDTGQIPGDIDNVDLVLAGRLGRVEDADGLIELVRNSLAPTIQRFEQHGEGTPERRADVISRVLTLARGSSGAADLACQLVRYLQTQPPEARGIGYYLTVSVLAVTISSATPIDGTERQKQAGFVYHLAVEGHHWVVERDKPQILEPSASSALSSTAGNLALMIAALLQQRGGDPPPEAQEVLKDLTVISAATAGLLNLDEQRAASVIATLGFPTERPAEYAAIILQHGSHRPSVARNPDRARARRGRQRHRGGRHGPARASHRAPVQCWRVARPRPE